MPRIGTIILGILTILFVFLFLFRIRKFNTSNVSAITTHYGLVRVIIFATVFSYLKSVGIEYEECCSVLLVLFVVLTIGLGIFTAHTFSFVMIMSCISAMLGIIKAHLTKMSVYGAGVLATMAASASYIAAFAAIRISILEDNSTFYPTVVLGTTFLFNMIVGIPLYNYLARHFLNQL